MRTFFISGPLAQLVERFHGMEEAAGSNPAWSTLTNSNGKGSGNGSFLFGVTEVIRGLEGGSPIEHRPEAEQ